MGSSSGRHFNMKYVMFYMHRGEQSPLSTRVLTPIHLQHTITCIYSFLPDDETTSFETCKRQQKFKLNIN